ncbi:tail tubular protein A [Rhizobium phage RHph_X3_9]|nr:tail tubular protein A [Rhizobium phage RHph_X3_9]
MLRVLGESGVSYDMSLHPTVQTCNDTLDTVDTELQAKGWWFNKEYGMVLVPDNRGEVIVPPEALEVTVSGVQNMSPDGKLRLVRRDNRLYDTYEHTFELNTQVAVDLVMRLAIDNLPALAQVYVQHKAAETVFLDEDGDTQKLERLERRTALAWQALKAAELKNIAVNALDKPIARQLNSGWRGTGGRNPNLLGGRLR